MKKTNKKGFTLVEMLVVIAIIAILVSILVPTVLGATKKAKASTDAANLRSTLAEFQIKYLTEGASKISDSEYKETSSGSGLWIQQTSMTCKSTGETVYVMIKVTETDTDACFVSSTSATTFDTTKNISAYAKIADGTATE